MAWPYYQQSHPKKIQNSHYFSLALPEMPPVYNNYQWNQNFHHNRSWQPDPQGSSCRSRNWKSFGMGRNNYRGRSYMNPQRQNQLMNDQVPTLSFNQDFVRPCNDTNNFSKVGKQCIDLEDSEDDINNKISSSKLKSSNFMTASQLKESFSEAYNEWKICGDSSSSVSVHNPSHKQKWNMCKSTKKKLVKALSQPVESTKAERMMQMMGWQGGALGTKGEGIEEPLMPNISNKKRSGFGLDSLPQPTSKLPRGHSGKSGKNITKAKGIKKKIRRKSLKKDRTSFKMDALNQILEFVTDNTKQKLIFDSTLSKRERRLVRKIIETLNDDLIKYETVEEMELMKCIRSNNKYILSSSSNGEWPSRILQVCKDAPDHLYLITKEDLSVSKTETETNDVTETNTSSENLHPESDPENKDCREQLVYDLLLEFLEEFCDSDDFTKITFLGCFDEVEIEAINRMITNIANNDNSLQKYYKKGTFELCTNTDSSGDSIIEKVLHA